MKLKKTALCLLLALAALLSVPPGWGAAPVRTLTLGAYTTPREVYGKAIIPAFQRHWKAKTGQEVRFQESYLGSGAQARAIVGGFEADVAALSLEADVDTIARAGLIQGDWRRGANRGMVTRSVVVLAVREGNPKAVRDWDDLRRPGLQVLTPNVRTSGGAKWNICALYGAALRGGTRAHKGDTAAAEALLRDVLRNVAVMDKGARESMINFEKGVGDVAVTYENEVLVGRKSGETYEYAIPRSTILIENPAAVVDKYADKHGTRDLAEAFVAFLASAEAQRAFAVYGLRPVDAAVAKETAAAFPPVRDLFTIRDLGGWPAVEKTLFSPAGAYERAMAGAR
ncbi:MAG: sulfate ABC transporter substrate-binding protein [Thiobacillaceae bacterium]|jgi:sulfate transport system substrate-binding protein|nr:sulfate ABC transporter substrate-binding protein [Thiobacillaceae bacterium]